MNDKERKTNYPQKIIGCFPLLALLRHRKVNEDKSYVQFRDLWTILLNILRIGMDLELAETIPIRISYSKN